MKLYVAGPMTGIKDYNFPAFNQAYLDLTECGYSVINPADTGIVPGWKWANYLRSCLPDLLLCEGVATLPGWEQSRGAKLEVHVATELSMPVKPVAEWVDWRPEAAA